MAATEKTRLVLKVDIDTKIGFIDGVPNLMETFAAAGNLKASFFVAMGPDNSGRALKRLFKPGFLRKQLKSGAAASYGLSTMMYGLIVPGPIIARQAPKLLPALMAAGHEVGLHGWDHVYWHDKVRYLSPEATRAQLYQAARLFEDIAGAPPAAFAAPGWQVTNSAWQLMAEMGITHTSCTRGSVPFRPLVNNRPLPLLEIPTTMPSLDEALGHAASPQQAVTWLISQIKPGRLNVFTLHGEVEGRNFNRPFRQFLNTLRGQDIEFITLGQAALESLRTGAAPAGGFKWGQVPNRAGELAIQS